jgi:hypothetical protein
VCDVTRTGGRERRGGGAVTCTGTFAGASTAGAMDMRILGRPSSASLARGGEGCVQLESKVPACRHCNSSPGIERQGFKKLGQLSRSNQQLATNLGSQEPSQGHLRAGVLLMCLLLPQGAGQKEVLVGFHPKCPANIPQSERGA